MSDPEWMESASDRLLFLYNPDGVKGICVFSPEYIKPLVDDAMVKSIDSDIWSGAYRLNRKGIEAAEMLIGKRSSSGFYQPDWLLEEITK